MKKYLISLKILKKSTKRYFVSYGHNNIHCNFLQIYENNDNTMGRRISQVFDDMVSFGIGAGAKTNRHFTVENLVNALPASAHKAFFLIRTAIIVIYCGFISYIGFSLVKSLKIMGQTTPALRGPMWFMYSAIPIGLLLMIVRTIQFAIRKYGQDKDNNI